MAKIVFDDGREATLSEESIKSIIEAVKPKPLYQHGDMLKRPGFSDAILVRDSDDNWSLSVKQGDFANGAKYFESVSHIDDEQLRRISLAETHEVVGNAFDILQDKKPQWRC